MPQSVDPMLASVFHLRRYALLTSDTRETADENLRVTIDYLLRDRTPRPTLKRDMFATYNAVRSSLNMFETDRRETGAGSLAGHDRLTDAIISLPLPERQALILLATEEFSEEEAAYILDSSVSEVSRHHASARQRVSSAMEPYYEDSAANAA